MEELILSVSQLNKSVKDVLAKLSEKMKAKNVWVRGEISNLKVHYSGHIYFTLKDEEASLSAVMYKSSASRITDRDLLQPGRVVEVRGRADLYEKNGGFQFYAEELRASEDLLGELYRKREELKKKLMAEGLFDAARKKPLPEQIHRVGIVTSGTGAVIHDIQEVADKRNPFVELILWPVAVQGRDAPAEIVRGIESFNRYRKVDVLIVGRGGGSFEDLIAFDDEAVLRAIAASTIPVISAVGHDTDHPLSDDVADWRAATPSHAAEKVTENIEERYRWLMQRFRYRFQRHGRRIDEYYQALDLKLDRMKAFLKKGEVYQGRAEEAYRRMEHAYSLKLERQGERLRHLGEKLHLVSPLALLGKGYAIVSDPAGRVVRKADQVKVSDKVRIRLGEGSLRCAVLGKEETNE